MYKCPRCDCFILIQYCVTCGMDVSNLGRAEVDEDDEGLKAFKDLFGENAVFENFGKNFGKNK